MDGNTNSTVKLLEDDVYIQFVVGAAPSVTTYVYIGYSNGTYIRFFGAAGVRISGESVYLPSLNNTRIEFDGKYEFIFSDNTPSLYYDVMGKLDESGTWRIL